MTRVVRASIAAVLAYVRFILALAAGLILVPFVIEHVGIRVYGLWLASGELLAYAAMADFGLLGTLPWLIAEADGRGDRAEMRRLLSTGALTALLLSIIYIAVVVVLITVLPDVLRLSAADRHALVGPVMLIAAFGTAMMTLRLFSALTAGLQHVRFHGIVSISSWALDVLLTVVLLKQGYGLYALAIAAAVPGFAAGVAALVRVRLAAPDLLRGWPRPRLADVRRLIRESIGAWFGQWGWRLSAATDGIVLASLGSPAAVTALACTSRLGAMLMQMSWVPGDNAMLGLANLHGERQPARLRAAVVALLRVNIALAGAAVCVVLAANPGFVTWWTRRLPESMFAGDQVNGLLAVALMVSSIGHSVTTVTSVLGYRVRVGTAAFASGVAQAALAFALGARLGVVGVVLASVLAQSLVLLPALARPFARTTGVTFGAAVREIALPLLARSGPLAVAALVIGLWLPAPPFWGVALLGAGTAAGYLWLTRSVYLDHPAIQSLIDRLPAWGVPPAVRRRLRGSSMQSPSAHEARQS